MKLHMDVIIESFPIAGKFVISRGSKTEANVVRVVLQCGDVAGHGECVPYARYGESVASVVAQVEGIRAALAAGITRRELQSSLPAGAARNAVDCAFWDIEAKVSGVAAFSAAGFANPVAVTTAYKIGRASCRE